MAATGRQERGFLSEDPLEQFDTSRIEFFKLADKAATLEDSLYWWAKVYYPNKHGAKWSGKDHAANLVREMFVKRCGGDPHYINTNRLDDDLITTTDVSIIPDLRRQERKIDKRDPVICLENKNPQLHELTLESILVMKSFILDILSVCSYAEKRLFVFILVENYLSDFLELFEDASILGEDVPNILEELYARVREEELKRDRKDQRGSAIRRVGKRDFVAQGKNKKTYNLIVKSFQMKVYPLFFPEEERHAI